MAGWQAYVGGSLTSSWDLGQNLAFTVQMPGTSNACSMWAINLDGINAWWNGEWLGVPEGGTLPGGYYCQCNDTIDVLDENGLIICSLRCTVTPNANPANTQNSVTFDGAQVLAPVSGVFDDLYEGPPYDWGYGCSVNLGTFNLIITGGFASTGPSCGCTINSLTTPSIAGAVTTTMVNPNADITHPSLLVFHCPDSNANPAAGGIGWQFAPGTSAGAFTFQYNLVAQAPTITSFTPASGSAGTTVTITGTNFTGAASGDLRRQRGGLLHRQQRHFHHRHDGLWRQWPDHCHYAQQHRD